MKVTTCQVRIINGEPTIFLGGQQIYGTCLASLSEAREWLAIGNRSSEEIDAIVGPLEADSSLRDGPVIEKRQLEETIVFKPLKPETIARIQQLMNDSLKGRRAR